MTYDTNKGYGLKLTKFDEQFNDCIIYRNTRKEIIELADMILITFGKESLMSQLNEMQAEASVRDNKGFEDKYKIRPYFINLILDKYNMKVLGW